MHKCKGCGVEIDVDQEGRPELPCSLCGGTILVIDLEEEGRIEIREMLDMRARATGVKRPVLELRSGEELRVSKGDWVSKERRIDRLNDHYMEKVADSDSNVIHELSERLSEHTGHGSARRG